MPMYDIICESCGDKSVIIVHSDLRDSKNGAVCEKCNSPSLKRVFSAPHFLYDNVSMKPKAPEDWRQFLKTIKKNNKGCADFNDNP